MVTTANFGFNLPVEGGSLRTWGGLLNDNWTALDTLLQDTLPGLLFPVGSIMIRADAIDPATIVPGSTWTLTSAGKAIVGAGGGRTLGDLFGADARSIDVTNLPAHTHAGSNLAISTAANHTHSSGNFTTNTVADHTHNAGSYSTSAVGNHTHTVKYSTLGTASGGATRVSDIDSGTSNTNTASRNTTDNGAHSHNLTGASGNAGSHSHNVSGNTGSGGSHSHSVSGSTGSAGGGVDFDTTQASMVFNVWERTA